MTHGARVLSEAAASPAECGPVRLPRGSATRSQPTAPPSAGIASVGTRPHRTHPDLSAERVNLTGMGGASLPIRPREGTADGD